MSGQSTTRTVPGNAGPGAARTGSRTGQRLSGLAVALGMVLFLGGFAWGAVVYRPYTVPTTSMSPTIGAGDRVLAERIDGADVRRGDVVVFQDTTWANVPVLKRVVAVGGDTVRCCDKDGRITVNGVPLDEPYLYPGDRPSTIPFEVKVPEGRVFVLGDHRSGSADSRFHLDEKDHGTVAEDQVVGRAVVIAWPVGHWRRLEERETFAAVPDARPDSGSTLGLSHSVSPRDLNGLPWLPTPAELLLVMGVVGLSLFRDGRLHGVRSGCGGFGGRRTIRTRRARGEAGAVRRALLVRIRRGAPIRGRSL